MKRVLVTGASSGIGKATVDLLAARGFFVYADVRRSEYLELWKGVSGVRPILFDVRRDEEVARAFAEVQSETAEIYAIVNNAGISNWGPILDVPDEFTRENLETNLLGPIRVTRTFLPLLSRAAARVVNVSSISGRLVFPFMGPYHISKAGLEAFSDTLRRELIVNGDGHIRVSVIEPGSVNTRLWDRAAATTIFPETSRFYQTAMSVGHAIIRQEKAKAFDPAWVAQAVLRALSVPNPRTRYVVSPESFLFRMLQALPDRWLDGIAAWALRRLTRGQAKVGAEAGAVVPGAEPR